MYFIILDVRPRLENSLSNFTGQCPNKLLFGSDCYYDKQFEDSLQGALDNYKNVDDLIKLYYSLVL